MWRSRWWVEYAVGSAVLAMAMVSAPPVGCTEQPLAGISWTVVEDSDQSIERQAQMVIGQRLLADQQARPSPAWLDLHGGSARAVNREPDLWRHEF